MINLVDFKGNLRSRIVCFGKPIKKKFEIKKLKNERMNRRKNGREGQMEVE